MPLFPFSVTDTGMTLRSRMIVDNWKDEKILRIRKGSIMPAAPNFWNLEFVGADFLLVAIIYANARRLIRVLKYDGDTDHQSNQSQCLQYVKL